LATLSDGIAKKDDPLTVENWHHGRLALCPQRQRLGMMRHARKPCGRGGSKEATAIECSHEHGLDLFWMVIEAAFVSVGMFANITFCATKANYYSLETIGWWMVSDVFHRLG
jgi:hypothetical protein